MPYLKAIFDKDLSYTKVVDYKVINDRIFDIFETINMGLPMDLIAVDLKEALDSLSEVTGEISTEDLLDHVFKNFCVGK